MFASDKPFESELKNTKYSLFDSAMFYQNTADYMLKVGNTDKMMEMQYKADAVMSVIVSMGWEESYKVWEKTGEIK